MPPEDSQITILQLTSRSDIGGGPRHLLDLIKGLMGPKVRIIVAAPSEKPFGPLLQANSDRFIELPHRRFSFIKLFELIRVIGREKIDIIHSHGRGAGIYSRFLSVSCGIPVIHTFHGVHNAEGISGRLKLLTDQILSFFPFFALFVSNSEKAKAIELEVIRSQKSVVLLNSVDLTRFEGVHRTKNKKFHIGAFLRSDFVKGPDHFLRLVAAIEKSSSKDAVEISCAGITLEELSLESKKLNISLSARLVVLGKLDDPIPWLKSLDLFVSTARMEGLPLGVLEAMASETPCLLSNIEAHKLFFDEGAALSFDLTDENSFMSELKNLMNNPTLMGDLAGKGRNLVERNHSQERYLTNILAIYHVVKRKK